MELQGLQQTIAAVAERAGPAVVSVGRGAGVVIGEGRVLTNAHNVTAAEGTVRFADGRTAPATLAGADVDGDLAVLTTDTGDIEPIGWGSGDVVLGTPVVALAPTRNGVRASFGTVSATGQRFRGPRGRLVPDALEHTAPLARGSSGGPVFDVDGALVGVNTHRRSDAFYLAVPATAELRDRLDALAEGGAPARPRLGIAVTPAHVAQRMRAAVGLDDRPGLLIRGVDRDGPAAAAGIQRGDLLVAADGQPIEHSDELFALLDGLEPDATLSLELVRGTEERTVEVDLSAAPPAGS